MADSRLSQLRRSFIEQNSYENYCRYAVALQRATTLPPLSPWVGIVRGWVPAAIHLFAPWDFRQVPKYWAQTHDRINDELCMPSSGILGTVLYSFFANLRAMSPRRCTCGGEERRHAPNCEIIIGTGDFTEDFYDVMHEWFSRGHRTLLNRFLTEGMFDIHDALAADDDYNIQALFNVINVRLGWNFTVSQGVEPQAALDQKNLPGPPPDATFEFVIQDWGPTRDIRTGAPGGVHSLLRQDNKPLSSFGFRLTTSHNCEIWWNVRREACDETWLSQYGRFDRTGMNMSVQVAKNISSIPELLESYRVWSL